MWNEVILDIEIVFGHTMKIYEDRRQMLDNLFAIEAANYKIIDTNPARGMLVFQYFSESIIFCLNISGRTKI